MSVHKKLVEQVTQVKSGTILFPSDFRGFGADTAIKMGLSRLASKGAINRLAHGIYIKPIKNKKKAKLPGAVEIAKAIATQEKIRIQEAGAYALYLSGFETSMPEMLTYVTDGEPRKIVIGNQVLVFKATTPKKLSMKGPTSGLLIQSLEALGKDKLSKEILKKVRELMNKEDQKVLMDDIKKAPAWIYNLLIKIKTNNEN